ncbi:MAG: hypothetical protein JXB48_07475, partial [Candidatus Latescibacteria bacterium]|nr:hypothetical protein [Candidatus Latescibacterota bacterium]
HALWVAAIFTIPVIPLLTHAVSKIGSVQREITVLPAYSDPQLRIVHSQLKMKLPQNSHQYQKIKRGPETNFSSLPPAYPAPTVVDSEQDNNINSLSVRYYPWAAALVVYICGVLLLLLWIITGRLRIRSWIRNGDAVIDPRIIDIFHLARKRIALPQDFMIIESDDVPAPMACRTLQPVIILPSGIAQKLSDIELQAVALHELTHIKRYDVLILTIITIIRALFFFHPLIWLAARQISNLSEIACDDAVLESAMESTSYAGMLTRMASELPVKSYSTELAAGILVSKSAFFRRIETILSDRRDHIRKLSRLTLAGTFVTVALSLAASLSLPIGYADRYGDKISLSGKVIFQGAPVPGAEIYYNDPVYGKVLKVAVTDKKGRFSFRTVSHNQTGDMYMNSAVLAYSPQHSLGWIYPGKDLNTKKLTIHLFDRMSATGTVTDLSGKPLKDVEISYMEISGNFYGSQSSVSFPGDSMQCLETRTDSHGRYKLKWLPPGVTFTICAKKTGYANEIRYDQLNIPSSMKLHPEGRIQGKIIYSATGKPVKNLIVKAVNVSSDYRIFGIKAQTDSEGNYTLTGLSSGTWKISPVLTDNHIEWCPVNRENVTLSNGETINNVDFEFIKGGYVTGRVIDNKGRPIANHWIGYLDSGVNKYSQPQKTVVTDKNGRFMIHASPGKGHIFTSAPEGYEQTSRINREIEVFEEHTVYAEDFVFKPGIQLHGTVRNSDGKPAAGAMITDARNRCLLSIADEQGTFTISGLKNGENLMLNAFYPGKDKRGSVRFKINADTEVEILLEDYQTTDITGNIVDIANKPISGATVHLIHEKEGRGFGTVDVTSITDKTGFYRLKGLIVGERYSVLGNASGYSSSKIVHHHVFTAEPDMPSFNNIVLERADRWIEGRIIDNTGTPVIGATITVNQGVDASLKSVTDRNGKYRIEGLSGIMLDNVSVRHSDFGYYSFDYVPTNSFREFEVIKTDRYIAGIVIDSNGDPVEGARVGLKSPLHKSGHIVPGIRTDSDGRFRFDHILEENIGLYARHNDYKFTDIDNIASNDDNAVIMLENSISQEKESLPYIPQSPSVAKKYAVRNIEGKPELVMDGDLSDWRGKQVYRQKLTRFDDPDIRWYQNPTSEQNLSGRFSCATDNDYFYVKVNVIDNKIQMGFGPYNSIRFTDCVELLFYSDNSEKEAANIIISAEKNGHIRIEGKIPEFSELCPNLWNAVGARAGLKTTENGYAVECAIPWSVLNRAGWQKDTMMGMNVRVYDCDEYTGTRYLVEWADAPGRMYNELTCIDGIPDSAISCRVQKYDKIFDIIDNIETGNLKEAEKRLKEMENASWVKPMQGIVFTLEKKWDDLFTVLYELAQETEELYIRDWCLSCITYFGSDRIDKRNNDSIIPYLENAVEMKPKSTSLIHTEMVLARSYVMNGDFVNARFVLNDILNAHDTLLSDRKIREATQMLTSLDTLEKSDLNSEN